MFFVPFRASNDTIGLVFFAYDAFTAYMIAFAPKAVQVASGSVMVRPTL